MKSSFLTINWKNVADGIITAFIGTFLGSAYAILESAFSSGTFPALADFKPALYGGLLAVLGYLGRKFLQNENGEYLKKDPEKTDSVQFKARA